MELLFGTWPADVATRVVPTVRAALTERLGPWEPRVWVEEATAWVVIAVAGEVSWPDAATPDLDGVVIDVLCEVVPPTAQLLLFLREPPGRMRLWFTRGAVSADEAAVGLHPSPGSGFVIDVER